MRSYRKRSFVNMGDSPARVGSGLSSNAFVNSSAYSDEALIATISPNFSEPSVRSGNQSTNESSFTQTSTISEELFSQETHLHFDHRTRDVQGGISVGNDVLFLDSVALERVDSENQHDFEDFTFISPSSSDENQEALILNDCSGGSTEWSEVAETPGADDFQTMEETSAHSKIESPAKKKRRSRGPFQSIGSREETARTRQLKACVRCRLQHIKCKYDEDDPEGICLTCKAAKPTIHKLTCVRYILTDCVVIRPWVVDLGYTTRFPKLELVNITGWESSKTCFFIIRETSLPSYRPRLKHRKFVPQRGDLTVRKWTDNKSKKSTPVAPFALENMAEAAEEIRKHMDSIGFEAINKVMESQKSNSLIRRTYDMAIQQLAMAQTEEERIILQNLLRLWLFIQQDTGTSWLEGPDTADLKPVEDSSYPLVSGRVLQSPVSMAQVDILQRVKIINPLRKRVLDDLQRLIHSNKPQYWLTVYLSTFILLHSCALVTEDRYRHALKHASPLRYTLPRFVEDLHHSSNIMLAHYHYYKGDTDPFSADFDWKNRHRSKLAHLTTREYTFLRVTARMVKEQGLVEQISTAEELALFEDEMYFVSQIFETAWKPRDNFKCPPV